jgi:Zn-dependent protease
MLQEPAPTPYDLPFRLLGFQVRVSAWFWLGALFFGFSFAQSLDRIFEDRSPGLLPLLLLWMACLLVSILIHELGHTLAYRYFGIQSSIVLYHFGGLAIPGHSNDFRGRSPSSLTPKERITVSLAGPMLQMASGLLLWGIIKSLGYGLSFVGYYPMPLWPFDLIPGFVDGDAIERPGVYAMLVFYLFPSFLWAILNLIPVLPLDGGRVCSSLVEMFNRPMALSFQISLITSIGVAVYAYSNGHTYLALMFALFGYNNYQMVEQASGRRY